MKHPTTTLMCSLLLGLVSVYGSESPVEGPRVVGEVSWLQDADPAADFQKDIRAGNVHFIVLTGQGPVVPYTSSMRKFMCYSAHAGEKTIDVGACFVSSDDNIKARTLAFEYGAIYNQLLVEYLDDKGLNDCSPYVDWDAIWEALGERFRAVGFNNRGTYSLGRDAVRIYLNNFSKHERVAAHVCDLLHDYHLDRDYYVEISPRKFINTDREDDEIYRLKCNKVTRSLTSG